ncbi:hypothetical protein TPR58_12415 [Sphingomonas sp. HF-S3]|uniref:Uncharacterized protein n=1 Tax=Sphingomonas rustica TaxID=3103142 RepID=A0ABV0BBM0_9SPHN
MKKFASVLAAAATFCLAAPVMAQDDVISILLGKTDEVFASKGFKPTGWTQRGTLANGGSKTFKLTLAGDGPYAVIGMCDTDCEDVNLVISDASGAEVDKDVETDDAPIVLLEKPGTYSVRIDMKACKTDSCDYGMRAFTQ